MEFGPRAETAEDDDEDDGDDDDDGDDCCWCCCLFDGDEIPVAMGRMKLFSQVHRRDPSGLRTFGPNSFRTLRAERAQFTTPRSVAKETPPEAGAPRTKRRRKRKRWER